MSTLLTINIQNSQAEAANFYVFQEPANYEGGSHVYSNAIWSGYLGNNVTTGGSLTFQTNLQFYAGIQQSHTMPRIGQSSGFASAIQPVDLATNGQVTQDSVTATLSPLGLSIPVNEAGVQGGAFRINVPAFSPPAVYTVGSAMQVVGQGVVMSNFVIARPNNYVDCQPILKFYVATGDFTATTVMNFTQASRTAALCDFTGGATEYDVMLNVDGTWTVS